MPDKLSIIEFGQRLIDTNDLDPVYVVLHSAQLEPDLLKHWLLAYFCFYHMGTASWICEGDYWQRMGQAAASKEYPRSSERRHFRGQAAIEAVAWLQSQGVPALFKLFTANRKLSLDEVTTWVRQWKLFGPWIAFKVADMLERLGLCQVEFSDGAMFLFDSPREGAELAHSLYGNGEAGDKQSWAVQYVLNGMESRAAPPRYERPVNAQEAETVLCKWKSYMAGHYELGEDIHACRRSLLRFTKCSLSQRLLAAGKAGKLW